jgi:parvulin-like peptidyl-prolyl isomerase
MLGLCGACTGGGLLTPAVAAVFGLSALLAFAACHRAPSPAPDAVAQIAGEEIRYERFAAYLSQADGEADARLSSEVLSALFDQFLDEQLLAHLATDRGLVAAADRVEPRRAVEALLRDATAPSATPSDHEVAAYYAAHRDDFARPERVRLRQILVESRATAERAWRQIAAGADFAEVARRLAKSRTGAGAAGLGGELSRADLPAAYADLLFALPPGGVSHVIPAPYGFHIFQVVAHLPSEVAPLSHVAPEIRARLARQAADRRLAALVREGRKRYHVEVYARNLPFDYEGTYRETKPIGP